MTFLLFRRQSCVQGMRKFVRQPAEDDEPMPTAAVDEEVIAALRSGDQAAFAAVTERYRRQLHVHCYRMLGSFDDAEEILQETFLRAWRARRAFEGRASLRSWLYRIATNACLDVIARRRPQRVDIGDEVTWLQPYPDRLLEPVAPSRDEPEEMAVSRETIELAFIVAIQYLPPRQRAVLIARDIVGLPAKGAAAMLDMSVASVNSALQRARATLRSVLPERRTDWTVASEPTAAEREVLRRYIDASERADLQSLAALLREDVRCAMPPQPGTYVGRATLIELWRPAIVGPQAFGEFRIIPTGANRQPAAATYVRRAGHDRYRPLAIDVLRIEDGLVAEVTTFGRRWFQHFGLPSAL
jgi:RNA polymerase sigma-70 factor (ECF subfamily)